MRTCEALVTKRFKNGKLKTIRPHSTNPPGLEPCGGTISFSTDIVGGCQGGHFEGEYCYCGYPEVIITPSCSRCSVPYFPLIDHICAGGLNLFTRMLNEEEAV